MELFVLNNCINIPGNIQKAMKIFYICLLVKRCRVDQDMVFESL